MSVSLNSAGWTVITPGTGDRVIYCSSSTGSDSNDGLSASSPLKTLGKAESLIRNNTGDQLLLKAGDTFYGNFIFWTLNGKSAQEPIVIGSYGTGNRPKVMSGTSAGLMTGSAGAKVVNNFAIMGIEFDADGRDPNLTSTPATTKNPTGINLLSQSTNVWIENCKLENYDVDINVQDYMGPMQNIQIRRNVIVDSWATNTNSQGLYVTGVTNLTVEGNVFDHNGCNEKIVGAEATFFNHDCYIAAHNSGVVVKDNIFSRAAGYGLQARAGGTITNNIFINDPVGLSFGFVNGASTTVGGVTGSVTGNVFIGGANIGTLPEGQGMIIGNIKPNSGVTISNNIFTQGLTTAAPAMILGFGNGISNSADAVGINNLTVSNNIIYKWTVGMEVNGGQQPGGSGLKAFNHVTFSNNKFSDLSNAAFEHVDPLYTSQETFSGNQYYNTRGWLVATKYIAPQGTQLTAPFGFQSPNRSVATYDTSIGGNGTNTDFINKARSLSQQSWNANYTSTPVVSYITAGFATDTTKSVTPPRSAKTTFNAINYDAGSGVKSDNHTGLGYIDGGDWAEYKNIDFGTGLTKFTATIAGMYTGGKIQIRLDSTTGPIVGTLSINPTGGWSNYSAQSTTVSGLTGVHNLYLVFVGGTSIGNINTFTFG